MSNYVHPWVAQGNDLKNLANVINVKVKDIVINKTLADEPAENCPNCNRKMGLLDIANTAISLCSHSSLFLSSFFQGKSDQASPEGLKHRVNCYDCGELQKTQIGWPSTFDWTYEEEK